MSILRLSDFGYRRFGPLPAAGGGFPASRAATGAGNTGDYEVAGDWVRRRDRRRGGQSLESLRIVDVLDAGTDLNSDRLSYIDSYFRGAEFANTLLPELTTSDDVLNELPEVAENPEEPRCRGMYRLAQALNLAGRHRILKLFRDRIAPCFFRLYPQGRIAVIRYDDKFETTSAQLRVLYTLAQVPFPDMATAAPKINTLQNWHLNSLTVLGPLLIDLLLYQFYPFVGGFRAGPPGLDFVFLFEPAESYTPAIFPRSWLAIASTTAGFGKEQFDCYEAITNFGGPTWKDASHQRFRHDRGYTAEERLSLLRWYLGRVNRLLSELTDVANFTQDREIEAPIDPVFAFEHQLTVDRLARKTLLSMSLEEPGTAKFMAFEVAELYDGLSSMFGNHTGASDFFKRLFHSVEGPALLRDRLAQLPAPFGTELPALADRLYKTIEDTVIESVWLKSKLTPGGVLVRNKNLSSEVVVPRADFVADLMRVYRNGHHGYFTAGDKQGNRPSRYLFLTDGNLPAELSALPPLWWLAYVADPTMLGWKHLPVGEYD
ncbi:MAG: hypothetical protein C0467_23210 [Planctomycetaceae bacterium]|nr:hypothetical protein [Planctomycetaceae bacterium]